MAKKEKRNKKLALLGGKPVLTKSLPSYNSIGKEEVRAVTRLMKDAQQGKALLSGFLGRAGERFLGGPLVQKLEKEFQKRFKVRYAVSYSSATTALQGAVTALGVGPGDEVITSPFTMPATATAILLNGAVPIFADINPHTYCITAENIKKRITKKTKAIIVVNLFGGSADYDEIIKLAKKYKLKIIEDNAQAPEATYKGQHTGTIGDIGVFSFNVHKHMQSGEGGMLVTGSKQYAHRARLARNHAEAVIDDFYDEGKNEDIEYIAGSNYRLTELQSAIVLEQIKKLNRLNKHRIFLANYLSKQLKNFSWLEGATVLPRSVHVYYLYPIKFFENKIGITRKTFARAMAKEGFPMQVGYQKPLYLAPIYKEQKIYEHSNFPFGSKKYSNYKKGSCPVTERLYEKELFVTTLCQSPKTKKDIDLFIQALQKIEDNKETLKVYEKRGR